jgi:hypothetical protein
MLGQPDPISPLPWSGNAFNEWRSEFRKDGIVSIWAGNFPSVAEAEVYFGIPDETGVYLPAEAFAADFGLGDFPPEILEVNFEQVSPRPLRDLLENATFGPSFCCRAIDTARQLGIHEAQGVALLYNFEYALKPAPPDIPRPLTYIGAFPFVRVRYRARER